MEFLQCMLVDGSVDNFFKIIWWESGGKKIHEILIENNDEFHINCKICSELFD